MQFVKRLKDCHDTVALSQINSKNEPAAFDTTLLDTFIRGSQCSIRGLKITITYL
jgi:hypothetical protein